VCARAVEEEDSLLEQRVVDDAYIFTHTHTNTHTQTHTQTHTLTHTVFPYDENPRVSVAPIT
jgi:hypothetical protein